MKTVVHLTSVHPRHDTRILPKECRSLAAFGYDTRLVVADGRGEQILDGVHIYDVGTQTTRFRRMLVSTRAVLEKAAALNADLYHLHDPELLPAGIRLKRTGAIVIFDAHEDVPKQLLSKPYLNPVTRRLIAGLYATYERRVIRRYDAVITVTHALTQKYRKLNGRVVEVCNYPVIGELDDRGLRRGARRNVCYVGVMTAIRGIRQMVNAMELIKTDSRLRLAGHFDTHALETEVNGYAGWSRVDAHGYLDRDRLRVMMAESVAGLVLFQPLPNHIEARPNKMFEYMSAGLPVIASDFPLWKEIIEGNACGVCVNPGKPGDIAAAIDTLVRDVDGADEMGNNGRRAVEARYQWAREAVKLRELYEILLASG